LASEEPATQACPLLLQVLHAVLESADPADRGMIVADMVPWWAACLGCVCTHEVAKRAPAGQRCYPGPMQAL